MFCNVNTFLLLAVSALLLLGRLCDGRAIPAPARRDVSDIVRRDPVAVYKRDAKGLVQPIWLSDDGAVYYTNVSFGTPPQPLTLAISMTGTTWAPMLPSGETERSFCADNANALACEYAQISGFYTISSSTFSPKDNVTNLPVGEDTINGTQAVDTVKMGTTSFANVGIALAQTWQSRPQLSLSATAATNESGPQLLSVMKQAGIINTLTYSLSFGTVDDDGKVDYANGQIGFGGIDESQFYGELSAYTAERPGVMPLSDLYWVSTALKNVSLIDETSQAGQLGVAEISLTPYLWLQDDMFGIIISLFANATKTSAGYTAACGNVVRSLQFSLAGTVITIPSALLQTTSSSDPDTCNIFIRPMSEYPAATTADYILGFPFLRAAYTVFDYTHGQTFIASRRLVPSTTLTPVGADDAAISAFGATLTTTIHPATSTLTSTLTMTSSTAPSKPNTAPTTTITQRPQPYAPNTYKFVGPVVGGVVGGIVFIALIIVFRPLVKAAIRRRRRGDRDDRQMAMQRRRVSDSTIMSPIDIASIDGDDDDDDEKDAELIAAAIAMSISDAGDPPDERDVGEAKRDSITIDIHGMEAVSIDPSTVGVAVSTPPVPNADTDTDTETETDKDSDDESVVEIKIIPTDKKGETEATSPDGDGH
ncbi:Vacuolar protease A [Orbilia brochopaga]|uniref:Vacuolar protease A n=1 Tax=Orbilia brochopaga TaxID=3140254 RepID=A0AAV9V0M7_9PEZI